MMFCLPPTHSYLLTGDDRPECTACRCPLAVKHFLLECAEFSDMRIKYFTAASMKDLFNNTDNHVMLILSKISIVTIVYNIPYSILSWRKALDYLTLLI